MISIIIPVLNEARALPATLHTLSKAKGPFEIIIADGRSSDATRAVAAPYGRVVDCEPGRARQMNCGASQARGNVLLFLHADVLFPPRRDRCNEQGSRERRCDRREFFDRL